MATNPDELDPEIAGDQLMFILGAAAAGVPLDADLRRQLWRLLPFVRALRMSSRDNPSQMRERWWQALQEPGPFGLPFNIDIDPSGLPSINDDTDNELRDDIEKP
jgi:hypothetical protein